MTAHSERLGARHALLLARSARLRAEIGAEAGALARRLGFADRIVALSRAPWIRVLLSAATGLLLLKRPRRLLRVVLRLLTFYPTLRPLRVLLPRLGRLWRHGRGADAAGAQKH